jgi:YfiH family protein
MDAFAFDIRDGICFLTCPLIITEVPLVHAFSTRIGGVSDGPYGALNLGLGSGDERPRVQTNRQRFGAVVGFDAETLVTLRQVHGNRVIVLTEADDPAAVKGTPADALVTSRALVPLAVITADCFPVLLVAPCVPAIGVVHAGRRGTAARVTEITAKLLCARFNIAPQALYAAIGPGIGGCCYEVDDVSAAPFYAQYTAHDGVFRPSRLGHSYLDLQRANLLQLQAIGVPQEQMWGAHLCTACHPEWFYSYRRQGARSGRMLNVAMLRPR